MGLICLAVAAFVWWRGFVSDAEVLAISTVFSGGFFTVLALFSLGIATQANKVESFRLINATVMTRAERPTQDSWVHLAQTSTNGFSLVLGFGLAGLGCIGIAVYAGLQGFGVIAQVNTDVSEAGPILAMLFLGGLGMLLVWIASLMIRREHRSGRVGARPSGIALGEATVAVNVPGRDVEIPWAQITGIGIVPGVYLAHGSSTPPMIRLTLGTGPVEERAQMLSGSGYRVPVNALYTALRWYWAHPESRWELGRIEGEQRLAAWCSAGRGRPNSR